jgi:TatD DNase family protein
MIIDTHIHLYAEEFNADREQLITKAIHNGVSRFYLPNIDSESIDGMHDLEKKYPEHCYAMMGLHPCSVKENVEEELKIVRAWLEKREYVAIGEIGMDLYWDKTFFNEQVMAFKKQIEWALEFNYPIVIHCREAFDEIFEVLSAYTSLPQGIFHCFSGNEEQALKITGLGFKLGIGGVLTFKNSGLDKAIQNIPLQDLVLETDAPYLAPVPFRGKRNEPVFILEVAKKLAEVKETDMETVQQTTSVNALSLFQKNR